MNSTKVGGSLQRRFIIVRTIEPSHRHRRVLARVIRALSGLRKPFHCAAEYLEAPLAKATGLNSVAYEDVGGQPPPRPPLGALEAHWGSNRDPMRVSLTFEKEGYEVGEPLIAFVLARNCDTN